MGVGQRIVGFGQGLWETIGRRKWLAGLITTGAGAAAAATWTFAIDTAGDTIAGEASPVEVTVLNGGADDRFVVGFPDVPPVAGWTAQAQDDPMRAVRWAKSNGGTELDVVRRRLVFKGGDETVVVVGLRARILQRHRPTPVVVDTLGFLSFATVEAASIDLDADDPVAVEMFAEDDAGPVVLDDTSDLAPARPFFAERTLSLIRDEPATLDVWITSEECDCDFELVLDVVVDGEQRTQVVRDADGAPFRIGVRPADADAETGGYYVFGACDEPGSLEHEALVWNAGGEPPGPECLPLP